MRFYRIIPIFLGLLVSCFGVQHVYNANDNGFEYKLVYTAEKWEVAKAKCEAEGAMLAIPKTEVMCYLTQLIPPAPFHLRDTRRRLAFHPYVVDVPATCTKRFADTFIVRTAKVWNSVPANVFLECHKLDVFKEEFKFIQSLVRAMKFSLITNAEYGYLVWLGFRSADCVTWFTFDGEPLEQYFNKWSEDNGVGMTLESETGDDVQVAQVCAGLDALNDGLRDWKCSHRQPYICQRHATTFVF